MQSDGSWGHAIIYMRHKSIGCRHLVVLPFALFVDNPRTQGNSLRAGEWTLIRIFKSLAPLLMILQIRAYLLIEDCIIVGQLGSFQMARSLERTTAWTKFTDMNIFFSLPLCHLSKQEMFGNGCFYEYDEVSVLPQLLQCLFVEELMMSRWFN